MKRHLCLSKGRFVILVTVAYLLVWVGLAVAPVSRADWALENLVVVIGIAVLAFTWRRHPLSKFSYVLVAGFLVLHAIGAHYTYSEVPYRDWFGGILDRSAAGGQDLARNGYDRFVHFAYGLLIFLPYREIFLQSAEIRYRLWGYLVPLSLVLSTSLVYELLEWAAAIVIGGDTGIAFVGSQGDVWDAQKDSFCAIAGAFIACAVLAVVNWKVRGAGVRE